MPLVTSNAVGYVSCVSMPQLDSVIYKKYCFWTFFRFIAHSTIRPNHINHLLSSTLLVANWTIDPFVHLSSIFKSCNHQNSNCNVTTQTLAQAKTKHSPKHTQTHTRAMSITTNPSHTHIQLTRLQSIHWLAPQTLCTIPWWFAIAHKHTHGLIQYTAAGGSSSSSSSSRRRSPASLRFTYPRVRICAPQELEQFSLVHYCVELLLLPSPVAAAASRCVAYCVSICMLCVRDLHCVLSSSLSVVVAARPTYTCIYVYICMSILHDAASVVRCVSNWTGGKWVAPWWWWCHGVGMVLLGFVGWLVGWLLVLVVVVVRVEYVGRLCGNLMRIVCSILSARWHHHGA